MKRNSRQIKSRFRAALFESLECRSMMAGDTSAGTGLLGQYYDNADLSQLISTRTDNTVSFNWGLASPAAGVGSDTFSVRWSGQLEAVYTEQYSFHLNADDGARLWVNGRLLIDRWANTPIVNAVGNIDLVSGRKYDIVLEYFENTDSASISLEWSSSSQIRQTIPKERLFPAERGTLSREVWSNVPGSTIASLTSLSTYPATPTFATSVSSFESISSQSNYGERIRGFLSAPVTGEYTFYLAASENAEIWLSNSVDPLGKQLIATVPSTTGVRAWNQFNSQRSAVITLVAGERYYLETLHKISTVGSHLAVGWTVPNSTTIEVVAGEHLSPILPEVTLYSESPATAEGSSDAAKFSVMRSGPLSESLTVSYTVRGTGLSGTDVIALPGSVTIPAGERSALIQVVAINDALIEGNESIVIELTDGVGYSVGRISERVATATVQDNIAAPAGGTSLLAGTALSNFTRFGGTFTTLTDPAYGSVIQAAITSVPANAWDAQLRQSISTAVVAGDVLFAEFFVRSITPNGNFSAIFEQGASPFTKSLQQGLNVNSNWQKVQLPFVAKESYAAGAASFGFHLGNQLQTLQFANFRVLNYGPSSVLNPAGGLTLNNIGGTFGSSQTVSVAGQPFTNAYEVTTDVLPTNGDTWRLQLVASSATAVQLGDNVRVEFWARSVSGANPRIGVTFQESYGSYTTLSYNQINPSAGWQKYTYNTIVPQAYATNTLQLAFNVGFGVQKVQIADFKWTNTTRGADLRSLPSQMPSSTYAGRQATDTWRADAENRIAQNRMANMEVRVTDSNGVPIDGAVVMLQQREHGFKFGTAVSGYNGLLSPNGTAAAMKYQSEIRRLFNTVVIENNLKWPDFANNRQLGIDAANWAVQNGMYLRGHNVLWPSRNYMPAAVWTQYDSILASQGSAAAQTYLRNTINARVIDAATTFSGLAGEWDVVNEPFTNNDAMAALGNDELLQWFQLFRANDPLAKRTLNDYDIFARNGANTAHRANFDYWLGRLVSQNLIETIGEQSHYSDSNLTDIPTLGTLIQSYYTTYNRPIAITEFDFDTRNEQLQADYLRDYMTMVFSQPGISEFVQWGFWSNSHWLPESALYRSDFSIKPNGQAYEDLVFGDWWSDTRGTSRNGAFQSRVFTGEYQVTVMVGGQTVVTNANLGSNGASMQVVVPGNRVPTAVSLSNRSIAENVPSNSLVGTLSTIDPDSGNTFQYSLVGGVGSDDNALFQIIGNELRSNQSFDFETRSAYKVRVRSRDQGGFATEMSWTIQIKNSLETEGMKTDLLVPLYQFPTFANAERTQLAGWWGDIVASAGADQPITVIVNPNNGAFDPGANATAVDYQIYVDAMRLIRSNPYVRVLGYVPTGYTTRSLAEVTQQLNWFEQGYKDTKGGSLVDGIFIDEVLGDSASVNYYRSVRDQVRSRQLLANNYLMANPGTVMSSATFYTEPLADGFVVFENVESPTGPGDITLAGSTVPVGGASGVDFGAIVHTVPAISDLQRVAKLAKGKGYSFLFVTNDALPNPFDNRPAYWSVGLDELHRPVIQNQSMSVAELTPVNTVVGTVNAFDPDPNQSLSYVILSGNSNNAFSIDGLGQIRTAAGLDFENTPVYSLVVQVTDSGTPVKSDVATVTIQVTNVNEAPVLTVSQSNLTGNVLSTLTNSGNWADAENNIVTFVASIGTVQKNADGTWNWSYVPTAAMSGQSVTITATDNGNLSASVSFLINANVQVSGRGIYYAGATGSSAIAALGTDKTALLPGQSSTYSHYTNYSRGLNGVTVDIAGLPSTTTATQFLGSVLFSRWNGIDAAGFTSLPATAIASATIEAGQGLGGSTRVRIRFPDNSIENTWLRVIVQSGAVTGLAADDVFYFGNVIGELNTGNTATRLRVNSQDTSLVRNNQSTGTDSASVTNIYDINRDGRVNSQDTSIVRNSQQTSGIVAPITVPPLSPPASPPAPSNTRGGSSTGGTRPNEAGASGGPRLFATTAPTDIKLSSSSIREDAVTGSLVGLLTSVDLDPLETHTYELVEGDGSTSNGHFRIVGDSLMTSSTFALDGTARYTIRIRSTDSGSLSFEKSLFIDVLNAAPTIVVANALLDGVEGRRLLNSGTYLDVGSDTVELTASEGTVEKNADGTWNWWLDVLDDTLPTRVTITARDEDGGSSSTSFTYSAINAAPVLTRKYATVNRSPLAMLTNTGTYADVIADAVALSASIGTILEVGDGAWTWFLQPTGVINNQTVTITATDKNGGTSNVTFIINAQANIATRAVVYNNAAFPGSTANPAGDKVALLPGQTATFANYTNYSRGLNGIVVDMAGLPTSTTQSQILDSLIFSVWNGLSADGFASLPAAAVPSVSIERGAGAGGSARVRISFPDNTIQNTWLRTEVIANANTGLVANDVFYFGNVIGDLNVGNVSKRIRVNAQDVSAVRNHFTEVANAGNPYDLNRDGRVDVQDVTIVRNNQQTSGMVALISAVPPMGRSALATPRIENLKWDDWSADPLEVEKQNWWSDVLIDEKGGRSNKSLERSSSMQSVDAFFESY